MKFFKNKDDKKEELKESILRQIKELGDVGANEAIMGKQVTAKIAMDRLDQIRLKTKDYKMQFAESEAERQIDRIQNQLA